MIRIRASMGATLALALLFVPGPAGARERWSAERANAWHAAQPWPSGCNYITSSAINQLEMWQGDTFDPVAIDRELGWAEGLGFSSVRVFLHDLAWAADRAGFLARVDQFLVIAERHRVRTLFVFFDSCWDPRPALGRQRGPRPGLHNSGWVQSPGKALLTDPSRWGDLEEYVKGVVGRFKDDPRVLGWDLFNEPDNTNDSSYARLEPRDKVARSLQLLGKAYDWARAVDPSQPLTSAVWAGDWDPDRASPTARLQLAESDVLSFHSYTPIAETWAKLAPLLRMGRPILCTEYMARPVGSRFDPDLGFYRDRKIGAYNWGFVDGKSQTKFPWDSWKRPYPGEPPVWFHDILHADGTPYDPREVAIIRAFTGKARP